MEGSLLLFTFLFSTLVATGFSLSCVVCDGVDEKSCKGSQTPCSSESDICMAMYKSKSNRGQEKRAYSRYCGPRTLCGLKESISVTHGSLQLSSSCCFTNNCIPPMPVFPQTKTEKNGVSCVQCQESEEVPCTSTTHMACTGDEKKCVTMTIASKTSSVFESVRGCGTPGLCNITELPLQSGEVEKEAMTFTCSSRSGSLQHSLFLLIVAAVFLVKVIG